MNTRSFGLSVVASLGVAAISGCGSLKAIPANRMPSFLLAEPRATAEPINLIRLRQDPPSVYQLGPRDILGVFIEGVLPSLNPENPQPPPVNFPEDGNTPPSIGYPIPVREDGTISLPLVDPMKVAGLTLTQTEDLIRSRYVPGILPPENARIVVTLMRKRTYQVLVIREDSLTSGNEVLSQAGIVRRGAAKAVNLNAYENDVLHALSETGGMPGLDAKAEVVVLRGAFIDAQGRDAILQSIENGNFSDQMANNPNVVRIPLRIKPGERVPQITEEDIILSTGDIVYIESREREVFYTGGLLQGKEQLLPRDYDLDVLGAIALAGGSVSAGAGGQNFQTRGVFSNGAGFTLPPSEVLVIRTTDEGYQIPIKVRLNRALSDPGERILIQPGDVVLLQYTPFETAFNVVMANINLPLILNYLRQ